MGNQTVMSCKSFLVLVPSLLLSLLLSAAENDGFPSISGTVLFELQADAAYDSDGATAEFNSLSATIEPALSLRFSEAISINAALVFEPVADPRIPGDDLWFDHEGLFVEALTLNYNSERFFLHAGKMGVNFGMAWDAAPGIYGVDIPEEYEIAERIGFGGGVHFGSETSGQHSLSASVFFADTSTLAGSVFTRRNRTRRGDGGPSNNGDLSSFAVALDGSEFPALPSFRYHLAVMQQGNGLASEDDELSLAIGAEYEFSINDDISVTPLIEYVDQSDAGGVVGDDTTYLTATLATTYKKWNLALAWTRKETDSAGGARSNAEQFQASAGYAFASGISVDVGWMTHREDGVDTDTFGGLFAYTLEF